MLISLLFTSFGFYVGYTYLPPNSIYPDNRSINDKTKDGFLLGTVFLIPGIIVDYFL